MVLEVCCTTKKVVGVLALHFGCGRRWHLVLVVGEAEAMVCLYETIVLPFICERQGHYVLVAFMFMDKENAFLEHGCKNNCQMLSALAHSW